jgi:flavin reductase (DIM6/NTAB) family NADH-FMN oxidoreductase RutF
MKSITHQDILDFEQRYRATFINSLGGFKSLVLIGTRSKSGNTNLAIFNSYFHLGANPPLFGIIIRPDSVERHTLSNILETGEFTVNHVKEDFYKQAHQTSARYPSNVSEFNATDLHEEFHSGIYAPFVNESSIKIHAQFKQKLEIEANGTIMIIAKINHVFLPDNCLLDDGFVDLEKAGTITCSGLDSYHTTKKLARLAYAKPDQPIKEMSM